MRMRISPYSTHDVRLDFFTCFVPEIESRLDIDLVGDVQIRSPYYHDYEMTKTLQKVGNYVNV